MTVMAIPNEQVDKVLSLSGKRGIIVDFAEREDKQKFDEEYVNIWLPQDWDMKKVLQKIEELPQQVKSVTRGIVPTKKGYALRTQRQHEAEITLHVNPTHAEKLGPALGASMKTSWVIKGVPSYADNGKIIKTLAQACNQWPGWVVRPKRPLTSTRGKYTTWLVEAAGQPPMETVLLNRQLISIEKYAEKQTQGAKTNTWFRIKATPRHEIVPGQIYQ